MKAATRLTTIVENIFQNNSASSLRWLFEKITFSSWISGIRWFCFDGSSEWEWINPITLSSIGNVLVEVMNGSYWPQDRRGITESQNCLSIEVEISFVILCCYPSTWGNWSIWFHFNDKIFIFALIFQFVPIAVITTGARLFFLKGTNWNNLCFSKQEKGIEESTEASTERAILLVIYFHVGSFSVFILLKIVSQKKAGIKPSGAEQAIQENWSNRNASAKQTCITKYPNTPNSLEGPV